MSEVEVDTILIVPLTSNIRALKYPHTIEVNPSKKNGLKRTSIALAFQLRAIDTKRLDNKVGVLESTSLAEIEKLLRGILKI